MHMERLYVSIFSELRRTVTAIDTSFWRKMLHLVRRCCIKHDDPGFVTFFGVLSWTVYGVFHAMWYAVV